MNRRSALLAAGGIVLAMTIAIAAIMWGLVGPQPAGADTASSQAPRVRTTTRTVEVHQPGGTLTVPPASETQTVATDDRDDAYEREDEEVEHPTGDEDEHEDPDDT